VAITLLATLSGTALAADSTSTDLPIDIDAIGRHGEEQRGVLTVRWDIDIFSETSDAQIESNTERQALELYELKVQLFQEAHTLTRTDPNEVLLEAATENELLFAEPVQFLSFTVPEDDPGISIWIIIPVIAACAGLGLLIALRAKFKRNKHEEGSG